MPAIADNALNISTPVVIQTAWNVNPGQTNTVDLVAYFLFRPRRWWEESTQIPSSRILGRMTTGIPVAFTAITQNGIGGVGTAGGSLHPFRVNIGGGNKNAPGPTISTSG